MTGNEVSSSFDDCLTGQPYTGAVASPEVESANRYLPERIPDVGDLVQVRSRWWLVEEIVDEAGGGEQSRVVRLAGADADAQGHSLDVFWDYEIDRRILEEEGWQNLAAEGFDP